MRFISDLKIAYKLLLGFGILAFLALATGSFSVLTMLGIKESAMVLSDQNMPAIKTASGIMESAYLTMYNARGYAFTDDKKFLDIALADIEKTKKFLTDAKELATRFNLSQKDWNMRQRRKNLTEYEQLIGKTITATESISKEKHHMLNHADIFIKAIQSYIKNQGKSLEDEIHGAVNGSITVEK